MMPALPLLQPLARASAAALCRSSLIIHPALCVHSDLDRLSTRLQRNSSFPRRRDPERALPDISFSAAHALPGILRAKPNTNLLLCAEPRASRRPPPPTVRRCRSSAVGAIRNAAAGTRTLLAKPSAEPRHWRVVPDNIPPSSLRGHPASGRYSPCSSAREECRGPPW